MDAVKWHLPPSNLLKLTIIPEATHRHCTKSHAKHTVRKSLKNAVQIRFQFGKCFPDRSTGCAQVWHGSQGECHTARSGPLNSVETSSISLKVALSDSFCYPFPENCTGCAHVWHGSQSECHTARSGPQKRIESVSSNLKVALSFLFPNSVPGTCTGCAQV